MSKPLKVLLSIDWFLPGTLSGGPVRSYANLIEHLKGDFAFYVITRDTDYGSDQAYEGISPNEWTSLNAHTRVYYISKAALNKRHLSRVIGETDFDIALINGIYSWYFSILPIRLLKRKKKPIIISARGMLNPQAFSVKGAKKLLFLKLAKTFGLYKGLRFHATNADEASHIKNYIGTHAKIQIAPNLPRKIYHKARYSRTLHTPIRLVNIARIAIEKGTLIMLEAIGHLSKPLYLDIFGPIYDQAYWLKCQEVIKRLPPHIEVSYKGAIASEKVPELLEYYDFFVMLSEGENFGHAILEALSAGCPVVISNRTPWKDLQAKSVGWDLDIRAQQDIVKAIDHAINMTDAEYGNWTMAAVSYAEEFIDNPEVLEQNKALFLNALKREKRV